MSTTAASRKMSEALAEVTRERDMARVQRNAWAAAHDAVMDRYVAAERMSIKVQFELAALKQHREVRRQRRLDQPRKSKPSPSGRRRRSGSRTPTQGASRG